MYFRQIYIFIIAISFFTTGCQKLSTDPGGEEPVIEEHNGLRYWGGSFDDFGRGVFETADGGYAVVGSQYSPTTQADLLLVKFSSSLEFESSATYSGEGIDSLYNNSANDIQQTADGGYVLVGDTFNGSNYDVLIVKFSSELTLTWQDTIKGTYNDYGNSVLEDVDGGFVVCGTSYDGNDEDIMLWKITVANVENVLTPSYSVLYNSEPTGSDNGTRDFGNYAQQTSDNGYVIVGTSATGIKITKLISDGTVDAAFGTDGILTVGSAGNEGTYIQQTNDLSYIVLGNTEGGAGLQSQVYLNTVSSVGVSVLSRAMGGAYPDAAESLIQTGDGGFIFTGYQYNENTGQDIWVVKLTPTLTTHWDKIYGGDYNDSGASIKATDDGGCIITGSTMSYSNQSEIILLEIESDGCIWSDDHQTKISCGL